MTIDDQVCDNRDREAAMRIFLLLFMIFTAFLRSFGDSSSNYQRGTIVAVERHQNSPAENGSAIARYEVSVRVRNVTYVTLYTPPNGANSVEYAVGMDVLVQVGQDTLKVPNKLEGTTEVPILRREALSAQPTIDWSKAPSQYFAMKMQNLSENLNLTDDQIARVKPIAEQETGEVGQFIFTSVIPRKERLKRWENIVRNSDNKMKPLLSEDQWEKLQHLRQVQKEELTQLIAQADAKEKQKR